MPRFSVGDAGPEHGEGPSEKLPGARGGGGGGGVFISTSVFHGLLIGKIPASHLLGGKSILTCPEASETSAWLPSLWEARTRACVPLSWGDLALRCF